MDELIIRAMEEKDLDQVACIEKNVFSQPWSLQGFKSSLESRDTIYLVAVKGNEVCGYCGLLQAVDEADITNVCVKESARNQGIAVKMLEKLISCGIEKNIKAFTLEVRVSNHKALHLYEKLGFENAGIRKAFYDFPKEDAVIMWKYI